MSAAVDCPNCGGAGCTIGVRPTCCGNLSASGDCRGGCAVPEEYQEQCELCGGGGKLDTIPEATPKERP
jgi:hypothetical protein